MADDLNDDGLNPDPTETIDTTAAGTPAAPAVPAGGDAAQLQPQQPDVTTQVQGGNQPMQSGPTVLIPEKRGGLGGLVDEIRNALVPQQATEVYRDPETGQRYVQHPTRTGGQQWARLASEAISGAAHGLQAGRGAGHMGDAAVAGINAGQQQTQQEQQAQEKQADEDYEIGRQNRIDKANSYLQQVQLASQSFALKRMQQKAAQDDISFANGQEDRERQLGSVDLGQYGDHYSLADVKKVHPEFWKDAVNGDVRTVPTFDENGERTGVRLFLRQTGVGDQPAAPGTTAVRFVPGKTPADPPTLQSFVPTGTHTQRDIDTYNSAAYTSLQKWQTAQAENSLKRAQTAEANSRAAVAPSEVARNNAEAARARTEAANTGSAGGKGQLSDQDVAALGEAAARGQLTEDEIKGMGTQAAKVQAYLSQHHPNLNQSSIFLTQDEKKRRDTANLALDNLNVIQSRLQRRPDLLGKIQGRLSQGKTLAGTDDSDLSAINEAIDNYALATVGVHGSRSGVTKEGAENALLNGFKNGSNATQSAIKVAHDSLNRFASIGTPRGLDGSPYVYRSQNQPARPAAQRVAPPPAGQIAVQIPGQPVGYIPQSALAQFRRDNPNAQVIQ